MTRLRRAALAATTAVRRATPDLLSIAGVATLAYGAAQTPSPWGAVLGPLVLGIGFLAAVRYGTR